MMPRPHDGHPSTATAATTTRRWAGQRSRRHAVLTLVSLLAALFVAVVAGAPTARAHDALSSTTPSTEAAIPDLPAQVTLTFNEPPLELGTQVIVRGPLGQPVTAGTPAVSGNTVTQPLEVPGPAGDYTVTYRITSSDGHPLTGTFTFTVATGTTSTTRSSAPAAPLHTDPAAPPGPATKAPSGSEARQAQADSADSQPGQSATSSILAIAGVAVAVAFVAVVIVTAMRRSGKADDADQA